MPSKKSRNIRRKHSRRMKKIKTQRGGVGHSLNLKENCKIGGLPERVRTSDCPPDQVGGKRKFRKTSKYSENLKKLKKEIL